ncbi:MAG: DNA cytosine methyltransferase [Methanomicrobiales archaeon]|nr:DNA cytosine methyltransferase [Methanomicrobiales archaeon]
MLDLFAGAGGLTEGFLRHNFDIIAHVEMDAYAARTLETRVLFHALNRIGHSEIYQDYYIGDISRDEFVNECQNLNIKHTSIINRKISAETEDQIIQNVQSEMRHHDAKKIDVIIGGPPCQAYSVIGRSRDPGKMKHDQRNYLYIHYLEFIRKFTPEIFLFENVPGIISARNGEIFSDLKRRIDDLGYFIESSPRMLNARHFGVLQNRSRIIFIGWKKEHDLQYPEFPNISSKYKVFDILNDLPALEPEMGSDGPQNYRVGRPSKYLREFRIRTDEKCVRNHIAKATNERDREIYRIAIKKWTDTGRRLKYSELPENLKTHNNQSSFLDRFKVVDGNGLSHSIVAHLAKDGHYYIHPALEQARSLTVREAARIQSFPDNYIFEGSRTSQYAQVGNAVPPLMAEGIAEGIIRMLKAI